MRALTITNSVTRRDAKSLEKYFTEISKYDVLSADQEVELFNRFEAGDKHALSKIVKHNLRFVVSVAKQYQHTGLFLGDLINEGNIGLLKAAKRFDTTKGFKFISYAVWWIRQSIIQAINEKGRKIRLPSNYQSQATKITNCKVEFLQKFEREPTIEELEQLTELKATVIRKSLANYKKCVSLDAPVESDGDFTLGNLMADQKTAEPDFELAVNDSQKKEVQFLLNSLTPKEATVISLFFGIEQKHPMTLSDIGERVGISQERVRQIKDVSLKKLRRKLKGEPLAI